MSFILSFLISGLFFFVLQKFLFSKPKESILRELNLQKNKNQELHEKLLAANGFFLLSKEREETIQKAEEKNRLLQTEFLKVSQECSGLQAELKAEKEKALLVAENNDKIFRETRERFRSEFENLSEKIFKEKSKEFSENSGHTIKELLAPLKQKIDLFQSDIHEIHKTGTAERLLLKNKMEMIVDSGKILAEETFRLTKALRGDVKKQGSWGELILQRVLESSGLRENEEYILQGTGLQLSNSEGKRMQPDIIVKLPDTKHIIIDSKMSYAHYSDYFNAANEEEKKDCLKKLILSVKEHVKGLSEKNYSFTKKLENPDFVLMFIPIESVFSLVMETEPKLFEEAWKKSIILVSPANLLAILRTVESLWKIGRQNKNTQKIAEEAASLYDKFVDFLKDVENLGKYLKNTNEAFDKALHKLSSGRGNLIKKAEDMKLLGLKTKKQIPSYRLEPEECPSVTSNHSGAVE